MSFEGMDDMFEALAIRLLHVFRALSPRKRPGLCPPACSEGHTYKWPCRARFGRTESLMSRFVNACRQAFNNGIILK